MLQSRIFSLSVLTNCHQIHSLVGSFHSLYRSAGTDVGEQIEASAESDVDGTIALPDGCLEGSFESIFVFVDGIDSIVANEIPLFCDSLGVYHMLFKLYGDIEGIEDVLDCVGDFWSDAISG